MATILDYALMAGASYISTRPYDPNKFPIPQGWTSVIDPPHFKDDASGFEAVSFTNGSEIVISFAGTYDKPANPLTNPDMQADLALAAGTLSDQLKQAADYYLAVKASAPANATITFTGHSLGGGLASLMAVMFGGRAQTFDQAPFLNSAKTFTTTDILSGNSIPKSVALDLRAYLAGRVSDVNMLVKLDAFIAASDPFNANPNPADTLAARGGLVTNINTQGEFLSSWFGVPSSNRIGSQLDIANINNISGLDLHAQSLLTAFLQSGDQPSAAQPSTTPPAHTLGQVTFKLPDLLKMIFDKNLYAHDTDTDKQNFIEHIVRHQTGGVDGVQVGGDGMVTRFTSDLWKIAQDGGLTMNESTGLPFTYSNWNNVSKALTAFAMQFYYEDTTNATNAGKQLFTDLSAAGLGSNGIRFDMHDVSKEVAAAMDANAQVDLAKAKGYQYFLNYLDTTPLLSSDERTLIKSMLPVLRDWYVQAGASGMLATDSMNRGAFMLGGSGADALAGGTAADLLVGNAGDDTLMGNKSSDTLLGGAGNDTYVYQTGDGFDTILDTDGQGKIAMDGNILSGGDQFGDARVHRDAQGHTYVDIGGVGSSVQGMVVDGNILVQNWQAGQLGINMNSNALADATAGSVAVAGTTGIDHISVLSGDNLIEAGGGNGLGTVNAQAGAFFSDYVEAGAGADHIYANGYVDAATAITQGNVSGSSQDYLGLAALGDGGNDVMVGSAGRDYLSGGNGSDLLIGGAGNDVIEGSSDGDAPASWASISYDDYLGTAADTAHTAINMATFWTSEMPSDVNAPATSQAGDVIYAGEGSDLALGGQGNDTIFGEGGNDALVGFGGNDVMLGGKGDDIIVGDLMEGLVQNFQCGNDYLDGGIGDDTIYGNGGDDILIGGANTDTLYGGAGQDTYIYNRGDGVDTIYDTKSDRNILRFGAGIDKSQIKLHLGSLMLDLGNGDMIHINDEAQANANGFDRNDVFNSSSISGFEFADGSTLTVNELLARGFDLDGTSGNDAITGTNTTDRITGLAGDDTLNGMDGNDTLTGGAGNDTLIGGNGSDTYVFNRGDGQDIIADGGDAASMDVLQFGADILLGDVSFRRTPAGDLEISLNGSTDSVTIQGWYTDNAAANRIEQVMFGDGSVLTPDYFAGLPITGTAGDEVIAGTSGNDTIIGLAGNDTLDGGSGYDTLIGGDGQDIYRFGYGMGWDTVTDASLGGNVIALQGGLNFSDLTAVQNGNDLMLSITGTAQGVTLKDYYLTPQDWTLSDANGAQQTMADVLTATANRDEYSGLRDAFYASAKERVANYYLGARYTWQGDGTMRSSPLGEAVSKTTEQIASTTTTTNQWLSGFSGSATTTTNSSTASYYAPDYGYSNGYLMFQEGQVVFNRTTVATDAASYADYSGGMSYGAINYWSNALIDWGMKYNVSNTSGTYSSQNWIYGYDPVTGVYGPVGITSSVTQSDVSRFTQDGKVLSLLSAPTNWTTAAWMRQDRITANFVEINGGASDNAIYTSNVNAVVNGGAGNDMLQGGGLLYGGDGNDTLSDAASLYGGNGNDVLTNGSILVGGAGNDVMDGGNFGTGDTRFLIDPFQSGMDLIRDTGDSEYAYKDWYYGSLGISNWQQAEQLGGKWVLWYGEGGTFNSYDAVLAYLGQWGGRYDPATLMGTGELYQVPALPTLNRPAANDYAALQAVYEAGIIPKDSVEFAPGIALGDLSLSWDVQLQISPVSGQMERYSVLNLTWNGGASQVQVVIPHGEDPLGSGVEQLKFSDGTVIGMRDLIAMAPPVQTLDPQILQYQPGMGVQTLGAGYTGINFGPGITASQITLGLGSLMLRVGNGGDVIHIQNFDPANALATNSIQRFSFADGTSLSYDQLLAKGFDIYGTAAGETLSGSNLVNRIYAADGGGSTLIGTGTSDTLVSGVGNDTLIGGAGSETFVVNDAGDVVIANASAAGNTVVSSVSYVAPENVLNITGSGTADITLTGNGLNNVITANSGNDTLVAGTGGGTLIGGAGVDTFVLNLGSGQQSIVDSIKATGDVLSFGAGITSTDVNFSVQGADVLISYSPSDSVLIKNFDLYGLSDGASPIGTYQFSDGSSIFVSAGDDGPGTFWIGSYDAQGNHIGTQWGDSGGGVGSGVYRLDGSFVSHWHYPDGSYGTNVGNADGSSSSVQHNADGSYSTSSRDATGSNWTTQNYAADGKLTDVYVGTGDGLGNTTWAHYDGNGIKLADSWGHADGSWGYDNFDAAGNKLDEYSCRADGSWWWSNYDVTGRRLTDSWRRADGTSGRDVFNADGSSSGATYNPDGTHSEYVNNGHGTITTRFYGIDYFTMTGSSASVTDGLGNVTITNYDAAGIRISDYWSKIDGSSGSDTYNADGSHSSYTLDGKGKAISANYDAVGHILNDNWAKTDGSYGSDTYNADGSHSSYAMDAPQGKSTVANYDAAGHILNDNWVKTDGSYGSDTYNADGSHSSYEMDAPQSKSTVANYDAAGHILNDNWAKTDGSYGSDTYSADGSHSSYAMDVLQGKSTVANFDAAGHILNDNWAKTDGSFGSDTYSYNADGSYLQQWSKSDGSSGTVAADAFGIVTGSRWHNANGSQGVAAGGNELLIGAASGGDVITGSASNEFLCGGSGIDVINTGSGADVIAFNRGGGADIINGGVGTDDTLSLGGGIGYNDIALSRVNNDLIVETGGGDQITLANWYDTATNHKNILNLQVVADAMAAFNPASTDPMLNQAIQQFDFTAIVNAFDQASGTSTTFMYWNATNSLLTAHLASSDTTALGGDLAHQYGMNGSFAGMSLAAAQSTLSSPQFGAQAQALNPLQGLQAAPGTLALAA